jgi:hypothetical protein
LTIQSGKPRFGVAAECGFSRARKVDVVQQLISIDAAVVDEP